jgi:hypothetical protein
MNLEDYEIPVTCLMVGTDEPCEIHFENRS